MERSGESILIDPELRKIVPILCDWSFIKSAYELSLQHEKAEGYRGYIPYNSESEHGWWTSRSKTEINEDNIATRRLTLESTELPLSVGFIAIGMPVQWDRVRDDEQIVRWDSRRNTVWVQPPDFARHLSQILDRERFAITVNPPNPDPVRYEDPKPISLVEVERKTDQKISPKKGMLAIDRTARVLKRSVGYQHQPQRVMKTRHKSVRSSRSASSVR